MTPRRHATKKKRTREGEGMKLDSVTRAALYAFAASTLVAIAMAIGGHAWLALLAGFVAGATMEVSIQRLEL